MEVDLHIHTHRSPDSMSRPEKVINRASRAGLGAIAVTDHDTWEGYLEAKRIAPESLLIIPGSELKTDRGDLIVLFVEEVKSRYWPEVIDEVRSAGGITIVPHPFESKRLSQQDIALADAMEVFNANCGRASNADALALAQRLGKPGFGSSDAHVVCAVGNGRTLVPSSSTVEELRCNLLKNPVVSRHETTNPVLHYANAGLCLGLKGVWKNRL